MAATSNRQGAAWLMGTLIMLAARAPQVGALDAMSWYFIKAHADCASSTINSKASKPLPACVGPFANNSQGNLRMVAIRDDMPETRWYRPVHQFKGQVQLSHLANVTGVYLRLGNSTAHAGKLALVLWPVKRDVAKQPITINGTMTIDFDTTSASLAPAAKAMGFDAFLAQLQGGQVHVSVATTAQPLGGIRGQTGTDTTTQYYEGLPDYLWLLGYLP